MHDRSAGIRTTAPNQPRIEVHESGPRRGQLTQEIQERHHQRSYYPDGTPAADHHAIRVHRTYKNRALWRALETAAEVAMGCLAVGWWVAAMVAGIVYPAIVGAAVAEVTDSATGTFVFMATGATWLYTLHVEGPAVAILYWLFASAVAASAWVLADGDIAGVFVAAGVALVFAPLVMTGNGRDS